MIYIYRLAHFLYRFHVPFLLWFLKVINRIIFSVSLPASARVGRNVTFGYQGLEIVVHRQAVLGSNIVISPNVAIGGRGCPGAPVI
ncbi:hypothetical protein [Paraburkholderia franconis]|uniref:hypothetical protein n=1 Tax=Paraburkholderia franconis TaxID=2654983 RepID=UPI001D107B20|nr:hypothetical protein [Paraburkholderia franconis]